MHFELGFLVSIVVILIVSRLFGEIAQRIGQPSVIGQLIAGLALGPSLFGLLFPETQHLIFPSAPEKKAMLQAFAEYGVLLLLVLTGMEVDTRLLKRIGAPAGVISATGVTVPFACGVGLGLLAPVSLVPDNGHRLITALFLGVALSISSIKIVAMVVREMNFARRDLGQIMVASSIIEDSIGWIILALILGLAGAHGFALGHIAFTVAGVAVFLALSLTIGRPLTAAAIRFVNDTALGENAVLTLILVIIGVFALITQALGVQTVLGAFVAGVLIGQSPILAGRIAEQLRAMVAGLFAPLFFALAGLSADLTVLKSPAVLALTLALVLVASVGKFLGAFLGGAMGGLARGESLALALGMNARGSTEVIVASLGLSMGALTQTLYSMIVTMAVVTTLIMPPSLRWALGRVPLRPGEEERLQREAFEANGFVANMERFLLAASDHPNGRFAARLVGLLASSRGQPATVLQLEANKLVASEPGAVSAARTPAEDLKKGADAGRAERPEEAAGAPNVAVKEKVRIGSLAEALSEEAPKGYSCLVLGFDPAQAPRGGFNPVIADAARAFEGPVAVAIARGAHQRAPTTATLRILAPVTGSAQTRRAAEVAVELARAARADLTVLFLPPPASGRGAARRHRALASALEEATLREIAEIAARRGQGVQFRSARNRDRRSAILDEARRNAASVVVYGAERGPSESLLFGETADSLLEGSEVSLLFVAS